MMDTITGSGGGQPDDEIDDHQDLEDVNDLEDDFNEEDDYDQQDGELDRIGGDAVSRGHGRIRQDDNGGADDTMEGCGDPNGMIGEDEDEEGDQADDDEDYEGGLVEGEEGIYPGSERHIQSTGGPGMIRGAAVHTLGGGQYNNL